MGAVKTGISHEVVDKLREQIKNEILEDIRDEMKKTAYFVFHQELTTAFRWVFTKLSVGNYGATFFRVLADRSAKIIGGKKTHQKTTHGSRAVTTNPDGGRPLPGGVTTLG